MGPIMRFDHHRAGPEGPRRDASRGIWYGALELETCACEVFGRDGVVRLTPGRLAVPRATRALQLRDLRDDGAQRAGVPPEATTSADRELSWRWSREIYENTERYGVVDGLIWTSARTGGDCLALYERARNSLQCPDPCSIALSHPRLTDALLRIAQRHRYELAP
jgi:RES domain